MIQLTEVHLAEQSVEDALLGGFLDLGRHRVGRSDEDEVIAKDVVRIGQVPHQLGRSALAAGAPVLVDVEMVAAGITRDRLPAANRVICTLGDTAVAALAREHATTHSAAAVEFWKPHLAGSVVAIGTAPTALYRLLELIGEGADKPALVLGFPVGFIGAVESKQALSEHAGGVPFITLHGRLGGSALAAAAVNALAGERS